MENHNQNKILKKSESLFWDNISKKYSMKAVDDQPGYEKKLEMTQEILKPNFKVLELGCGTGSTALIHADKVQKIVATDFSSKMIEIAKGKASSQGIDNINFLTLSAHELSGEDEKFDVIMTHSLLHLIADRTELLDRIYASLKTEGYFVASCIYLQDHFWWFKGLYHIGRFFNKLPYLSFFTREQQLREIERVGFKITEKWDQSKNSIFLIAQKI